MGLVIFDVLILYVINSFVLPADQTLFPCNSHERAALRSSDSENWQFFELFDFIETVLHRIILKKSFVWKENQSTVLCGNQWVWFGTAFKVRFYRTCLRIKAIDTSGRPCPDVTFVWSYTLEVFRNEWAGPLLQLILGKVIEEKTLESCWYKYLGIINLGKSCNIAFFEWNLLILLVEVLM